MSAVFIMVGYGLVGLLATAAALRLVAAWFNYRRRSMRRALAAASLWYAVLLGLAVMSMWLSTASVGIRLTAALLFVADILMEIGSIRVMFGTGYLRALGGWASVLVVRLAVVAVGLFVVHAWVVEAFTFPALSMAPTVLPMHYEGVCSRCGGPLILNAMPMDVKLAGGLRGYEQASQYVEGYCMKCRQVERVQLDDVKTPLLPADRFMVNKLLMPRRWDLVVYHTQGQAYLKRVIGTPGEEISIDDEGQVSVNGKKAGSPPDAPGMRFAWPDLPPEAMRYHKVSLGADEYFVIGDFAERSVDSRLTGPVKASALAGVVTWIYWPPSRMRIVR